MKFGVVNKSTILNRFVLHTLQRNITHLAVITRKTNIKLGILKGGTGKEPKALFPSPPPTCKILLVKFCSFYPNVIKICMRANWAITNVFGLHN